MIIALDYDKTYTLAPSFWDDFILMADDYGHMVYIVTARSPTKDTIEDGLPCEVIYCDGVAKRWALHHFHDIDPDIWIDDKPDNILFNSTATKEQLTEWRANGRV
jgi:hypothetical protein